MSLFTPHERALRAQFERLLPSESIFAQSCRYALYNGGKRIRPWCLLTVLKHYKANIDLLYPYAAALEAMHTYSLIHDDLPCMDNDDLRRGQPTLHRKFDEPTALMTGSYLLTLSFAYISESSLYSLEQKKKLSSILSTASLLLLEGQALDLQKSCDLETMYAFKTGALFSASLEGGAVICDLSEDERLLWREIGLQMGILFQIADDCDDGDSLFKRPQLLALFEKITHKLNEGFRALTTPAIELQEYCMTLEKWCKEVLYALSSSP